MYLYTISTERIHCKVIRVYILYVVQHMNPQVAILNDVSLCQPTANTQQLPPCETLGLAAECTDLTHCKRIYCKAHLFAR